MAKIKPLIRPILGKILERFPEYHGAICYLFTKNQSFKEICLDYEQCCKTLRYWQKHKTEESKQRTVEYEDILNGLEQEIMQYLIEYDVGPETERKP